MTDNLTEAQIPIPLWRITPSSLDVSDNPRGLWPYRQYAKTKLLAARIIECYDRLAAQGVRQAGPRTIGYRLEGDLPGRVQQEGLPQHRAGDQAALASR